VTVEDRLYNHFSLQIFRCSQWCLDCDLKPKFMSWFWRCTSRRCRRRFCSHTWLWCNKPGYTKKIFSAPKWLRWL